MNSGEFDRRVSFEQPTEVRTTSGASTYTFESAGIAWARVERLAGREAVLAAQMVAQQTARITVPWSPLIDQIDPRWRIRDGLVVYEIVSIANPKPDRRDEAEFLCQTGVKDR